MKLPVFLVLFWLSLGGCRLLTRSEPQTEGRDQPVLRGVRSPDAGPGGHVRVRPLFARRGKYAQQRVPEAKPKVVPAAPSSNSSPAKVEPKPVKPKCSQLTQSCWPVAGCCDATAVCHCRFFNTICFCLRAKSHSRKKMLTIPTPRLS